MNKIVNTMYNKILGISVDIDSNNRKNIKIKIDDIRNIDIINLINHIIIEYNNNLDINIIINKINFINENINLLNNFANNILIILDIIKNLFSKIDDNIKINELIIDTKTLEFIIKILKDYINIFLSFIVLLYNNKQYNLLVKCVDFVALLNELKLLFEIKYGKYYSENDYIIYDYIDNIHIITTKKINILNYINDKTKINFKTIKKQELNIYKINNKIDLIDRYIKKIYKLINYTEKITTIYSNNIYNYEDEIKINSNNISNIIELIISKIHFIQKLTDEIKIYYEKDYTIPTFYIIFKERLNLIKKMIENKNIYNDEFKSVQNICYHIINSYIFIFNLYILFFNNKTNKNNTLKFIYFNMLLHCLRYIIHNNNNRTSLDISDNKINDYENTLNETCLDTSNIEPYCSTFLKKNSEIIKNTIENDELLIKIKDFYKQLEDMIKQPDFVKLIKMVKGGKNKSNYKKTDKKITVIYKKKKYTRVIYINERKKYIKINKTYMLLSKLKKDIK